MEMIKSVVRGAVVVMMLLPPIAIAHSANDPIKDIQKYDRTIATRQSEYDLPNSQKLKNIRSQVNAMEHKISTLRNLIASDYPHINKKMSKYSIDYMESINDTLVQLKKTLAQAETLLDK